ncbi:hypothetical protein [Vibrio sinaloensis]|uniref:hypothetical protein n=1 Tax=Photobacterium sp. (strain ATCC 43367) TaxID=379097 RepID=UPI002063BEEC|nr:hypothetical protein [Vibrio sinaloensis]UPQ87357.1 hypothetical protein MTO69_10030 [Vibrio sinaloensis]
MFSNIKGLRREVAITETGLNGLLELDVFDDPDADLLPALIQLSLDTPKHVTSLEHAFRNKENIVRHWGNICNILTLLDLPTELFHLHRPVHPAEPELVLEAFLYWYSVHEKCLISQNLAKAIFFLRACIIEDSSYEQDANSSAFQWEYTNYLLDAFAALVQNNTLAGGKYREQQTNNASMPRKYKPVLKLIIQIMKKHKANNMQHGRHQRNGWFKAELKRELSRAFTEEGFDPEGQKSGSTMDDKTLSAFIYNFDKLYEYNEKTKRWKKTKFKSAYFSGL